MARLVDIHPCFSCPLPDCNVRSKDCALKKARNAYSNAMRHGAPVTDRMRRLFTIAIHELYEPGRSRRRVEGETAR